MTRIRRSPRARARRRADMQATAQLASTRAGRRWRRPRCLSGSPDEVGPSLSRVARSAGRPTASPCLAKLNIDLTWLTSALRTWTISRRTRTNKDRRHTAAVCASRAAVLRALMSASHLAMTNNRAKSAARWPCPQQPC
jgi:hypothetical protein